MNIYKNIFRSIPLLAILLLSGTYVVAQSTLPKDRRGSSGIADSQHVEPTVLFSLPALRSVSGISTVSGNSLYSTPTANLTNTLYGRLPGLLVQQNSGEPGYDEASFYIRGKGTYDDADLVIYVDGFETTSAYFQYLAPSEINSISVLRDPASLASFGMKGANGVLWVTTKRGSTSAPSIHLQGVYGSQLPEELNKPLNSYNYASLYNIANSNDNGDVWTPKYSDAALAAYKNGTAPYSYPNVDWFKETVRNSSPYINGSIDFSGGNDNAKYLIIGDYMRQDGLWNVASNSNTSNSRIQRYNFRTNLDLKFFSIFEAKVDLGTRIEDRRYPNYDGPTLWTHLSSYPSNIYPVKDSATGNWSGTSTYPDNPVASLNALGWTSTHDRLLQANFSLKEHLDFITKGLYLNEAASFNTWTRSTASWTATYARYYAGVKTTTDVASDLVASGTSATSQYDWKQGSITAGYDRSFGKHNFDAAVSYLRSNYLQQATYSEYHYENLGGRIHYGYDNRYEAEFGFAYSGSDYYADRHHWAFYPALSLGWILSNESFLKANKTIDFLKLRLSAGKSGNEQSTYGRSLYQGYYGSSGTYYTGGSSLTSHSGEIPTVSENLNITAEHSMKYNVGIDMTLLRKLDITLDLFKDNRSGIIGADNGISATYGMVVPYANIGKVVNKGLELSLAYHDKVGKVGYNLQGLFSYAKNKIIYEAEIAPVNAFSAATGRPIGTPIGLVATGFYQTSDFDASGNLNSSLPTPAFGDVQPGDLKYKDLDGDGAITANDVTAIGHPSIPEINYSFIASLDYAGFDFSVLLQGVARRSVNIYSSASTQAVAFVGNGNVFPIAQGAWSYYPNEGIDTRAKATYPRLTTQTNTNNYSVSSFWEKSGDFLRVRSLELGYSIPSAFLKKFHMQKFRLYVNAVNPFTWSSLLKNYKLDPEHLSGYTVIKSYNGGILVDF